MRKVQARNEIQRVFKKDPKNQMIQSSPVWSSVTAMEQLLNAFFSSKLRYLLGLRWFLKKKKRID